MNLKTRFVFSFTVFCTILIVVIGVVAILIIRRDYTMLQHASNAQFIPIMAQRMFERFVWGFGILIAAAILISIPAGVYLSSLISRPYVSLLTRLSQIAQKRLTLTQDLRNSDSELAVLQKYAEVLIADFNKIRDFEKVAAWKEGARMMMHELKNPLTPLKLSAQNLSIQSGIPHESILEVQRILRSCDEIETILGLFKNLVNIEFAPKQELDLFAEIENIISNARENGYDFEIHKSYYSEQCRVLSEKMLLKLLFINLIKNGIEENPEGFMITVTEGSTTVTAEFITGNAHIENRAKMFKPGYSKKGQGRGFGLFLCRKISDYLDLQLNVENRDNEVVFTTVFNKLQIITQEKVLS